MQRSRRQDPYPLTWEVPLAVTLAVVLVLVLAAHLARGIANVVAGGPWRWPPRTELFSSLPALVRGDATAGLPPAPATASDITAGTAAVTAAGANMLWTYLVATEVVAVLLMAWLGKWALDRWGPARVRGMATRSDVEQLLGRHRLRRNRATIRPDLYPRHGSRLHHRYRLHHGLHQGLHHGALTGPPPAIYGRAASRPASDGGGR